MQIQPSLKGFKPAVAKEFGAVESMAAETGKRSGGLMSGAMGKALKVGGVAAAAGAGAIIGKALWGGFNRLNAIDQAEAKLRGLHRPAGEISTIMGSVKKAVDGTKYALDEAADAAAVFSTVGVKTGADMDQTMKLLTDTVSQSGQGFNEITSIFAKIRATGYLTTETFDMLNERGTGAGEAISKKFGVPMEQVRTFAKGLDWKDFAAAMEQNIGGAAQKSGDTFQGSFDNMMTSFNKLGAVLLQPIFDKLPPVFDKIKAGVANLSKWADNNDLAGKLDALGRGFVTVGGKVKDFGDFLARNKTTLTVVAGVITTLMLPRLLVLGTMSIWAGGQMVKGWLMAQFAAMKAAATSYIASVRIVAGWVAQGVGATTNAAKVVAGWVMSGAGATKTAATSAAASARIVAGWAAQGVGAAANAAKIAAGWALAGAGAVAAAAKTAAYALATGVVRGATLAWVAVQWLLNVALNANPISLIVLAIAAFVGGIILAYKNSETFRNIVTAAWNGIKTAVSAVWNWIKGTLWPGIKAVFSGIGSTAMWLYRNGILAPFNLVKAYFQLWWAGVKVVFGWVTAGFSKIGEWAGKAKDMVVEKFTKVVDFLKGLPGKIGEFGKKIFSPILDGAKWVFNQIAKFWNNTIGKLSFKAPDWVPGIGGKGFSMPKLPMLATGGVVRGPGGPKADKILARLSSGEFVMNAGAVNQYGVGFMHAVNQGRLPGYKAGGYVTPPGLTGGKIQTGNPPNIGLTTDLQKWMWDQIRAVFPSATMLSGTRTASVGSGFDNHMGARAIDIVDSSSVMMKIATWIADKFPGALELIHGPGFARQIKNGKTVGDGGGESGFYAGAGRHDDHVHWAMDKIVNPSGDDAGPANDAANQMAGAEPKTYDYSGEDAKERYDKDNTDAKSKYDSDLAALKAKYHIGDTNSDLKAAGGQITRDKIALDQAKRSEINAAGGDKDKIKAIRDRYKPQYDALTQRRENLSLQRLDRGAATEEDKAAYKAAKEKLDQEYKDDKEARTKAYKESKGTGSSGDQKSYPTTISGWAGFMAKEFVGGQVADGLSLFGLSDEPPALKAFAEFQNQVRVTDKNGKHLWGNYQPSDSTKTNTPPGTPPTGTPPGDGAPKTLAGMPTYSYKEDQGAEQWRPLMEWAIGYVQRGLSTAAAQVDAGVKQIQSESGGRPYIAQGITDINGTGEKAGVGLLQIIPATFAAHRDPALPDNRRNPPANIVAALRYYVSRYGTDLTKQWGHGHGYASGGWVSGPGGSRSDSIRARLSNGEFVVNAAAAGRNRALLEAVNDGRTPVAAGGPTVNYEIKTARVEDAFLAAQRQEKRRMAAGMASL